MKNNLDILEGILKELVPYEKKGLDTSSLKMFIKSYKTFLLVNEEEMCMDNIQDDGLNIVKMFLEDKKAFPKISDIIQFANAELNIEFKDQKASREITIMRIINRMQKNPELKISLKESVVKIRNNKLHSSKSKKDLINASTFSKWAEIIDKI